MQAFDYTRFECWRGRQRLGLMFADDDSALHKLLSGICTQLILSKIPRDFMTDHLAEIDGGKIPDEI